MTSPNGSNDFSATLSKAFEEINTAVSNYLSAVTKSSAAFWEGVENVTRSVGGITQESLKRTITHYSSLAAAKTPQEIAESHKGFLKDSINSVVDSSGKVSEISIQAAKSTINPLAEHTNEAINAAVNKAKSNA